VVKLQAEPEVLLETWCWIPVGWFICQNQQEITMNRSTNTLAGTCLLAAMTMVAPLANADGFYIGAGAYKAEMDVLDFDDRDTTPAAFVGYQFLDTNFLMLSAELGYFDLGDYSGNNYEVESSAITAAGVVYIPIGPFFEIYGKLGYGSIEVDTEFYGEKSDFDSEDVFGGFGFSFDILDTIDIYAEYIQFDNELDSKMVGVGVRFDFF
jgi:outer membrane protein with beta-barrel domain